MGKGHVQIRANKIFAQEGMGNFILYSLDRVRVK